MRIRCTLPAEMPVACPSLLLGNACSAAACTLVQTAAGSHGLENCICTTLPNSPFQREAVAHGRPVPRKDEADSPSLPTRTTMGLRRGLLVLVRVGGGL